MSEQNHDLISTELRNRLKYRIKKDGQFDDATADLVVDGTLSFLRMCAQHAHQRFAPSKLIDLGWHSFILHTRAYQEFCFHALGRFIHHEPTDPNRMDGRLSVVETVEFMRSRGISFRAELWAPDEVNCDSGPSGDCGTTDCNSDGTA